MFYLNRSALERLMASIISSAVRASVRALARSVP